MKSQLSFTTAVWIACTHTVARCLLGKLPCLATQCRSNPCFTTYERKEERQGWVLWIHLKLLGSTPKRVIAKHSYNRLRIMDAMLTWRSIELKVLCFHLTRLSQRVQVEVSRISIETSSIQISVNILFFLWGRGVTEETGTVCPRQKKTAIKYRWPLLKYIL